MASTQQRQIGDKGMEIEPRTEEALEGIKSCLANRQCSEKDVCRGLGICTIEGIRLEQIVKRPSFEYQEAFNG